MLGCFVFSIRTQADNIFGSHRNFYQGVARGWQGLIQLGHFNNHVSYLMKASNASQIDLVYNIVVLSKSHRDIILQTMLATLRNFVSKGGGG